MKFLNKARSKAKLKNSKSEVPYCPYTNTTRQSTLKFSDCHVQILENIFSFVCPHSADENYASLDDSMGGDCMLCDMRDLAHCALACKAWEKVANKMLYSNIRIDAVHYCEREYELSDKRKRKSWFDRNGDPKDPSQQRLKLLAQTVREEPHWAAMVHTLKMPYMTRESCVADIARTVSVLPNLRFVDLPEGFFTDHPSTLTLRQELQAKCPDIRLMKYTLGSERSFGDLCQRQPWQNLQVLDIKGLRIEPQTLLHTLGAFHRLRELIVSELDCFDDDVFFSRPSLPSFPPLQKISLSDLPKLTTEGLLTYLGRPECRKTLASLTLNNTGVTVQSLHQILSAAPKLTELSVTMPIFRSLPPDQLPPLASRSLKTLRFEITESSATKDIISPTESYYTYLTSSLQSNSLPVLAKLYVRDSGFPERLTLLPPAPVFASESKNPFRGLQQNLIVYSKGLDELEWNFTTFAPPEPTGRGRRASSVTRPISMSDLQLSPSWGGGERRSMIVGNGFGGFLAVPADDGPKRPSSSSGKKVTRDLWR
ncbi:MAG: hypothetical protein M1834_004375 [Cirrosporium novae-zelandiae]|nr:MAG: hypothetical protein M1834_004375 [Cirrosporium novae-zelandiae]